MVKSYKEWLKTNKDIAEKIINKNFFINVDYNGWSEGTIEYFLGVISKNGFNIELEDFSYSGFCSQGDGASFTGSINILTYLRNNKQLTRYRTLVKYLREGYIDNNVSIERSSSRYFHENTTYLGDVDVYIESIKAEEQLDEVLETLEELRKEYSIELYKDLEKDYNSLTSEESISGTLEANEYKFDEEGYLVA